MQAVLTLFFAVCVSINAKRNGVVEQQLGEKTPRTSTCPLGRGGEW